MKTGLLSSIIQSKHASLASSYCDYNQQLLLHIDKTPANSHRQLLSTISTPGQLEAIIGSSFPLKF